MVYSTEHTEINGGTPMMLELADLFQQNPDPKHIPFYKIWIDDNTVSSIEVKVAFDSRSAWKNKMYFNSRHGTFAIEPASGNRYYSPGEEVTVRLISINSELKQNTKLKGFKKYTGTPEQCATKLKKWLIATAELVNS